MNKPSKHTDNSLVGLSDGDDQGPSADEQIEKDIEDGDRKFHESREE